MFIIVKDSIIFEINLFIEFIIITIIKDALYVSKFAIDLLSINMFIQKRTCVVCKTNFY